MKKLVFLHSAGSDKTAYHDLMIKLADLFKAELVCFNAPLSHPTEKGKFIWFNKVVQNGRRDAVREDYFESLNYIKDNLKKISKDTKDIILVGHSQGGGMAVHVGLELNLEAAISFCGDLPYNIEYHNNSQTPIYWFEAGKDGYIDDNRKASYKLLNEIGERLHYQILPDSTHTEFEKEAFESLKHRI